MRKLLIALALTGCGADNSCDLSVDSNLQPVCNIEWDVSMGIPPGFSAILCSAPIDGLMSCQAWKTTR